MMMEVDDLDEKVYDIPQSDIEARRRELVHRIEDIVRDLVRSIGRRQTPRLSYDDGKFSGWSSNSSSGSNSLSSEIDSNDSNSSSNGRGSRLKTIRFTGYKTRQRFALIMRLMAHVHASLLKYLDRHDDEFYCTKRAFFYMLKNEFIKRFVEKQEKVEWAINQATMLLECAPWEIGFISTSKGLVSGDLTLHLGESRIIKYEQQSCHAVPDVVACVTRIRTTAEFVLVVEKDSVFQKLLREACPAYNRCILVTGKGYPDIATRMLVSMLSEKAYLPVYALVDANPHGFEIMCVYRFGTLNNMGYREQLLCPGMRWLGIHQNDLINLDISRVKLSKRDLKKIYHLQDRSYIDDEFSKHLNDMKLGKAEIESVNRPVKRFLTEYYIPTKIRNRDYF